MPSPAPAPSPGAPPSPAAIKAYRQQNILFLVVLIAITALTVIAVRSGKGRAPGVAATTAVATAAPRKPARFDVQSPPRTERVTPAPAPAPRPEAPRDSAPQPAPEPAPSAVTPPSAPPPRATVTLAPARPRTTDDIVLTEGRVLEGRVLGIREQGVLVRDAESDLEFEIPKRDIDRIVTRDGRTLRFGDGSVPLLGTDADIAPVSRAGRYRVRYAERWGTEREECRTMARQFAPGAELVVQHLRGAPMLRLAFVNGLGFNASVRADGVFETGAEVHVDRGPRGSAVGTRVSGRFMKDGTVTGVARITATLPDGTAVCDAALTLQGDRQPQ